MFTESPPSAPDVERVVLGAVFCEPDAAGAVASAGADLFFVPAHRIMAEAIAEMHGEGAPVDQLTLAERLRSRGGLDLAGGEENIARLSVEVVSSANLLYHIGILRDKAVRRSLLRLGVTLVERARDDARDLREVLGEHESGLEEARSGLDSRNRGLTGQIREWVAQQSGCFLVSECYREIDLVTKSNRNACRVILGRLIEEGVIERSGDRRGSYRRVLSDCPPVDFRSVRTEPLDLRFPLGEHELVNIHPGNIIVAAGTSNAGKTAWLIEFARLNMGRYPVRYFSSEMGAEEFSTRLRRHRSLSLKDWKLNFHERSGEFQDVIRPDEINIIDFLELYTDFYLVGERITRIFNKLGKGVAVIALQKNKGRDTGLGGERSLEKARLYLSIEQVSRDKSRATIVKAKSPRLPGVNPNRLARRFSIENGAQILPDPDGWHPVEE